jgi:hypothetical protein
MLSFLSVLLIYGILYQVAEPVVSLLCVVNGDKSSMGRVIRHGQEQGGH